MLKDSYPPVGPKVVEFTVIATIDPEHWPIFGNAYALGVAVETQVEEVLKGGYFTPREVKCLNTYDDIPEDDE